MMRPLLGVWSEPPRIQGGRLPRPEQVYRSDEEQSALLCFQGGVTLHEAWVDTGRRATSKPRWVVADTGVALPHRRVPFGRWYLSSLLAGTDPPPPVELTLREPHPGTQPSREPGRAAEPWGRALAWRVAVLVAAALATWWLG